MFLAVSQTEAKSLEPWFLEATGITVLVRPFTPAELHSILSLASSISRPCQLSADPRADHPAPLAVPEEPLHEKGIKTADANYCRALVRRAEREVRRATSAVLGCLEESFYSALSKEERNDLLRSTAMRGEFLFETLRDLDDLLDSANGELSANPRILNLERLLQEIQKNFRERTSQQGIEFNVHFDGPVPLKIITDGVRLKQGLRVLLQNALENTFQGRVELRVRYDDAVNEVLFQVCDTGTGILANEGAAKAGARIVRNGIAQVGLQVAHSVAHALDGSLQLHSVPYVGTIAELRIASGERSGSERIDFLPPSVGFSPPTNPLDHDVFRRLTGRVLVATNDGLSYRLLRYYIEKTKISVTMVSTDDKARERLHFGTFDILFIDMDVPLHGGSMLVERLRASGCQTPIIGLLSAPSPDELERCIHVGCDAFLELPLSVEKLFNVLALYLDFSGYVSRRSEPSTSIPTEPTRTAPQAEPPQIATKPEMPLPLEEPATKPEVRVKSKPEIVITPVTQTPEPQPPTDATSSALATFDENQLPNIADYVLTLRDQFAAIRSSIEEAGNLKAAAFKANQLAGGAALCGFHNVAELLLSLEAACANGAAERVTGAFMLAECAIQELCARDNQPPSTAPLQIAKVAEVAAAQPLSSGKDYAVANSTAAAPKDMFLSSIASYAPDLIPLILEFLESVESYIGLLVVAARTKDWDRARAIAHECAGVASMYGYPYFAGVASAIQISAERNNSEQIEIEIQELQRYAAGMMAGKEELIRMVDSG